MPIPMLNRRRFTLSLGALAAATPLMANTNGAQSTVVDHSVMMLNVDCNDANIVNVFEPAILRIDPGDSVQFLATDPSHNTASKRGMIPEGAEPWNGAVNEELVLTLTVPGIYGYLCLPHYDWGMVGLIVVGDDLSNLAQVKKVRHPGDARKNFRSLLKQLEEGTA
ncbi:MAG: pseudoazurin [Pseudomonadota bacterium]